MGSDADQSVAEFGGPRGILRRPEWDCVKLERIIGRLAESSGEERDEMRSRFCRLVFTTAFAQQAVLCPVREGAVDNRRLRWVGVSWELARRTASPRRHPVVSRRPPGEPLPALPLDLIDRLRDGFDDAARRVSATPARRTCARASQQFGALGRRLEQLAPLGRGERPETGLRSEHR